MGDGKRPFLLGVTGGIGSGKTQVCRILESKGARIFSADLAAKEILSGNLEICGRVTAVVGPGSYNVDGKPDFSYMAQRVFSDRVKLEVLNECIHPLVYEAFKNAVIKAEEAGTEILVLEAALLFESSGDKRMDKVCVVEAEEETRLQRAAERDSVSAERIKARMSNQMDNASLRKRADYIISNNGSLEELEKKVDIFWNRLKKDKEDIA